MRCAAGEPRGENNAAQGGSANHGLDVKERPHGVHDEAGGGGKHVCDAVQRAGRALHAGLDALGERRARGEPSDAARTAHGAPRTSCSCMMGSMRAWRSMVRLWTSDPASSLSRRSILAPTRKMGCAHSSSSQGRRIRHMAQIKAPLEHCDRWWGRGGWRGRASAPCRSAWKPRGSRRRRGARTSPPRQGSAPQGPRTRLPPGGAPSPGRLARERVRKGARRPRGRPQLVPGVSTITRVLSSSMGSPRTCDSGRTEATCARARAA